MASTPNLDIKIIVTTDWLPERTMQQRIAQAKADALIEFADGLPKPWSSLIFLTDGKDVTLAQMLEDRADEIVRAVG